MRATFGITEEFTEEEQLVQTLVADGQEGDDMQEMPLPNVKALVLAKVVEFYQHHKDAPMDEIQKLLKCNVLSESETSGPSSSWCGVVISRRSLRPSASKDKTTFKLFKLQTSVM
ncbi:hypothetical protein PI124_g15321 [Phytophthora idaei]|nr:hypothetical protein PI124_g15321 [Phytophthora idaei]